MKLRKKTISEIVPTDSLSDIAFLLIIFFILTTSIRKITGFTADIPTGQKSDQVADKTPTVALHEGRMLFNDNQTSIPDLRKTLADMQLSTRQADQRVVMLEATGKVNWQQYFEVMATIQAQGGVVAIVREE